MDITNFNQQNTLLIVEDEIVSLNLLLSYLENHYDVQVAKDGEEALKKVNIVKPALILMDVRMPRLNGFETCRRLKANGETGDIPVIFMTSLTEMDDKVKGFEAGAVDYITKPIQYKELLARISVHLSLRNLQIILEQQNTAIEQKNSELQSQNMELDVYAQILVDDLKMPLVKQAGFTNILMKELAESQKSLGFLQEIEQSRHKMSEAVDDMVLLANVRTQEVVMEAPEMVGILAKVRHNLTPIISELQGKLTIPATWPIVWGYSPWIEKVWEIYISNALNYGGTPPQVILGAAAIKDKEQISFWVRDNGPGFSNEQKKQLFVPLSNVGKIETTFGKGYGLKLSIVQLAIEKCGGQVGVDTQIGHGSTFYFTLPAIG